MPATMLPWLELRAPLEATGSWMLRPWWALAPRGDGHPVLVLPGWATGDETTELMRNFLHARGWAASGWGQGVNTGLHPAVFSTTMRLLQQLHAAQGRRVSLVGWSLGGVLARELARQAPQQVRQVITLGSPFAGPPGPAGRQGPAQPVHGWLRIAPPVPTTSIWSRTDAVVPWRSSIETRRHEAENIEVEASHFGMGAHPAVLYAVADRLAQPEGQWQPFHREGWRRLAYGDTSHLHTEAHDA